VKPTKLVLLTGNCTDTKCKKRSTRAYKVGDFWIEMCDDHHGKQISLDMNKVGLYVAPGSTVKSPWVAGQPARLRQGFRNPLQLIEGAKP
jgi:hypothetical protein